MEHSLAPRLIESVLAAVTPEDDLHVAWGYLAAKLSGKL